MIPTEKAIAGFGQRASEIAALCHFLAEALHAEPATSRASEAVEGLGTLSTALAHDLLTLADPSA